MVENIQKHIFTWSNLKLAAAFFVGMLLSVLFYDFIAPAQYYVAVEQEVEVVWPRDQVNLFENQVFIVDVPGSSFVSGDLEVSWSLEQGAKTGVLSDVGNSQYQAEVNVSDWDWKKTNEYEITFYARDSYGQELGTETVVVYVNSFAPELAVDNPEPEADLDDFLVASHNTATVSQAVVAPVVQTAPKPAPVISYDFSVEWKQAAVEQNQEFIYTFTGYDADQVTAAWSTEGGHQNLIFKKNQAGDFVAAVNMFGWRWLDQGPYKINFTLNDKQSGRQLASQSFSIFWTGEPGASSLRLEETGQTALPQTALATAEPETSPVPVVSSPAQQEPESTPPLVVAQTDTSLSSSKLYKPNKPAVESALQGTTENSAREALQYILSQPNSIWLNGDGYDSNEYIQSVFAEAEAAGQVPAFVMYNIPNRDCGSHSSGGTASIAAYKSWVDRIAGNLQNREAIVVIEPDALPQLNCLPEEDRDGRLEMLRYAAEKTAAASSNVLVYIDAGHPYWVSTDEMARRLVDAGVEYARGFALNVSNYISTSDNIAYGNILSNLLGGKKYVIDSSRNGNDASPTREWCNPSGRALGESPSLSLGTRGALDAVLWIKFPGESDGHCNGGPGAGGWWTEYAVDLYRNR